MAGLVLASLLALVMWADTAGQPDVWIYLWVVGIAVAVRIAVDILLGLYDRAWWHANVADVSRVLVCLLAGTATSLLVVLLVAELTADSGRGVQAAAVPHATFWLMEAGLALAVLLLPRVAIRVAAGIRSPEVVGPRSEVKRALVYGAGWAGVIMARAALRTQDASFAPVGFLDDDPRLRGRRIAGGVRVFGGLHSLGRAVRKTSASALLIAMPDAPGDEIRRVAQVAMEHGLEVMTLPSAADLPNGTLDITQVRHLQIEDLLRRPPTQERSPRVSRAFAEKIVAITGAAGSIGSELARQALAEGAKRIVLVDRAESSLYLVEQRLQDQLAEHRLLGKAVDETVSAHLVDVTDRVAISRLFAALRPDVVIHAAAYKNVPLMEDHPSKAVEVNVGGTSSVVEAAAAAGVGRFVLVSTDKAARPSNVMGATMRVAEMIVADVGRRQGLAYISVRSGNVIGSSGGVIRVFRDQLDRGHALTVTDPEATRSFVTASEAAWLILDAAALAEGPGLYRLDMDKPIRVMDIASDLIRLDGRHAAGVSIKVIGLRKGEALHGDDPGDQAAFRDTAVPKVLRADAAAPPPEFADEVRRLLEVDRDDDGAVRSALEALVRTFGIETAGTEARTFGPADLVAITVHDDVDRGSDVAIPVERAWTTTAASPADEPEWDLEPHHVTEARAAMSARDGRLKRLVDVVLSGLGLAVLAPAMGMIAIAVRKTSSGPAFYRHRRIGRDGVEFDVLKFRSMRPTSEWSGPHFTAADDPRITRVGRILRRYKLDELPQLWNVFRGDMSLVGPRPDIRGYMDRLRGREAGLLSLRPGITGPATLYLRDEERLFLEVTDRQGHYDRVLWPHKVRINLDYVERWSLRRDIAYLAVTALPSLDRVLNVIPTQAEVEALAQAQGPIAWWPADLERQMLASTLAKPDAPGVPAANGSNGPLSDAVEPAASVDRHDVVDAHEADATVIAM